MPHIILLVEDDPDFRGRVARILTKMECDVLEVAHHAEAMSTVKRKAMEINLAIVDLRLEGSQEHSAFEGDYVLNYLWERGILAIILTGHAGGEDESVARLESCGGTVFSIIDKKRFVEPTYEKTGFRNLVEEALATAAAIRESEGMTPAQRQVLEGIRANDNQSQHRMG